MVCLFPWNPGRCPGLCASAPTGRVVPKNTTLFYNAFCLGLKSEACAPVLVGVCSRWPRHCLSNLLIFVQRFNLCLCTRIFNMPLFSCLPFFKNFAPHLYKGYNEKLLRERIKTRHRLRFLNERWQQFFCRLFSPADGLFGPAVDRLLQTAAGLTKQRQLCFWE